MVMGIDFSKLRVLVVDDDEGFLDLVLIPRLIKIGAKKGNIIKAMSVQRGIEQLTESCSQRPEKMDLIISDWKMPGKDGIEFFESLKEEVELKDIPFILMSALMLVGLNDDQINEFKGAGIKHFVSKIELKKELPRVIKEALSEDEQKMGVVVNIDFSGLIVLAVDSDKGAREATTEMLEDIGVQEENVIEAENVTQAMHWLFTSSFPSFSKIDLVISDWKMPEINGVEFFTMCSKADYARGVPFILMSSSFTEENIKEVKRARIKHFISKMRMGEDLEKVIKEALSENK